MKPSVDVKEKSLVGVYSLIFLDTVTDAGLVRCGPVLHMIGLGLHFPLSTLGLCVGFVNVQTVACL